VHRRTVALFVSTAALLLAAATAGAAGKAHHRYVYTLTNSATGNALAVFTRADDGTLASAGTVATGVSAPARTPARRDRSSSAGATRSRSTRAATPSRTSASTTTASSSGRRSRRGRPADQPDGSRPPAVRAEGGRRREHRRLRRAPRRTRASRQVDAYAVGPPESVSRDGEFLHVLVDGTHMVGTFRIGHDGGLTWIGAAGTLPPGDVGLATS
jgi:hypothetical protein